MKAFARNHARRWPIIEGGRRFVVWLFHRVGSGGGYLGQNYQTIALAHREEWLPVPYIDYSERPVGYAVDLCSKIPDAVRRELKLKQLNVQYLVVTSSNRIPFIVEGRADLRCGSKTSNAERRKQVAFTIPHFMAAVRMAAWADAGIKNWLDLRDKRVVTTKGTTQSSC